MIRYAWILVVLVACTPQIVEEPVVVAPEVVTYQNLFEYDLVGSYEYTATTVFGRFVVTTSVERVGDVFELTNTVATDNRSVVSLMAVDAQTHACRAFQVELDGAMRDEPCPEVGLNSGSSASQRPVYSGSSSLTVPAGRYAVDEYLVDDVRYFIARDAPVPIRYSGEGFVMELRTYD